MCSVFVAYMQLQFVVITLFSSVMLLYFLPCYVTVSLFLPSSIPPLVKPPKKRLDYNPESSPRFRAEVKNGWMNESEWTSEWVINCFTGILYWLTDWKREREININRLVPTFSTQLHLTLLNFGYNTKPIVSNVAIHNLILEIWDILDIKKIIAYVQNNYFGLDC